MIDKTWCRGSLSDISVQIAGVEQSAFQDYKNYFKNFKESVSKDACAMQFLAMYIL